MQAGATLPILSPVLNAPSSPRLPSLPPDRGSVSSRETPYTPLAELRSHELPDWHAFPPLLQLYLQYTAVRHLHMIQHSRTRLHRCLTIIRQGNSTTTHLTETVEHERTMQSMATSLQQQVQRRLTSQLQYVRTRIQYQMIRRVTEGRFGNIYSSSPRELDMSAKRHNPHARQPEFVREHEVDRHRLRSPISVFDLHTAPSPASNRSQGSKTDQ